MYGRHGGRLRVNRASSQLDAGHSVSPGLRSMACAVGAPRNCRSISSNRAWLQRGKPRWSAMILYSRVVGLRTFDIRLQLLTTKIATSKIAPNHRIMRQLQEGVEICTYFDEINARASPAGAH